MRHVLHLSAPEVVAFQNALPECHGASLPVKTFHLLAASLRPSAEYLLRGDQIFERFGGYMHREGSRPPVETGTPLRVTEPVRMDTRRPVAEQLREAWLAREAPQPQLKTRLNLPEHTRFTAYCSALSLVRIQSLSEAQMLNLGVRQLGEQFTLTVDNTGFHTPQLALAAYWNAGNHKHQWSDNPWVWLLELDLPVAHLPESQAARQARQHLTQIEKENRKITAIQKKLNACREKRDLLTTTVVRQMRACHPAETVQLGAYRINLQHGYLKRV